MRISRLAGWLLLGGSSVAALSVVIREGGVVDGVVPIILTAGCSALAGGELLLALEPPRGWGGLAGRLGAVLVAIGAIGVGYAFLGEEFAALGLLIMGFLGAGLGSLIQGAVLLVGGDRAARAPGLLLVGGTVAMLATGFLRLAVAGVALGLVGAAVWMLGFAAMGRALLRPAVAEAGADIEKVSASEPGAVG